MTEFTIPPLLCLVAYQMGLHALLWGACSLLLKEHRVAVLHWAVFMLLLGLGLGLAGARGEARDWLLFNGSNLLTVLGFALLRRGTQIFMRLERHDAEQAAVLLPVLGMIALVGPNEPSAPLRITLTYAAQAFIVLRLLAVVRPALTAEFGRGAMLAVCLPGLGIGLVQAALALYQALHWRQPAEMQQGNATNQVLMYVYLAGAALFTFCFIVMVTQRLTAHLRDASVRDPLTGLFNRRAMAEALERQWLRHRRTQSPLAVLVIDIDHFKKINDTLGHAAGDSVLLHLSSLLQNHIRGEDVVGRVGGEEFLLILPDTPLQHATALGERLRVLVRAESLGTTISGGCSSSPTGFP
jgi:diguanylate cyclase (GGDEF)-like protein